MQERSSLKLKTPGTEVPGASILMGFVVQPVLRPSATPAANLQLSLPLLPLAAPVSNLRLASAALPPARPRANPPARIGVVSPGSVGGKYPAFTVHYALPIDWLLTFQLALASGLQLGLRLLPTHIWCRPSARQVLRLPVLTGFRRNLRLAPAAAAAPTRAGGCPLLPHRPRTSDSHRLLFRRLCRSRLTQLALRALTSGWAFDAPLASTEPCIAGRAVDEYSVSTGSCTLRICQLLTTSDLRRLLQSLARPAIPLRLSPQVSPSGWAGGEHPTLAGFPFRQPFRRSTPNALLAIS